MKNISNMIYNEIISDIRNGKYMIGDKIPSIRHMALF